MASSQSHFAARLRVLRQPGVAWYTLSCGLATFAFGLSYVAMAWFLVQRYNSVAAMAIMMVCFWAPNVLLGPFFGVLADRFNRKKLLLIANGSRAVAFILFAIALKYLDGTVGVYLLSCVSGISAALYTPTAIPFVCELVDKDDLLYANSTIDIVYELGSITGLGSAGIVLAYTSSTFVFSVTALLFIISIIALMLVTYTPHKAEREQRYTIWQQLYRDFVLGLRYLSGKKEIVNVSMIQLCIFVSFMIAPILLAPFARQYLHADAFGFGVIDAALSVGVVIGGLFAPWLAERYGLKKIIWVEFSFMALTYFFFKDTRQVVPAALLYVIIGFCYSSWPLIITRVQTITDVNFQGRVQSLFFTLSGLTTIVTYSLFYFANDFIAIPHFYYIEIALSLVGIILVLKSTGFVDSETNHLAK